MPGAKKPGKNRCVARNSMSTINHGVLCPVGVSQENHLCSLKKLVKARAAAIDKGRLKFNSGSKSSP